MINKHYITFKHKGLMKIYPKVDRDTYIIVCLVFSTNSSPLTGKSQKSSYRIPIGLQLQT